MRCGFDLQVVGGVPCDRCNRCEIDYLLNGLVGKSWQDLVQVVADWDSESATAFNHGQDRGHTQPGLLTADSDPVFLLSKYFDSRNYVHSQLMYSLEAKRCVMLRIYGPFAQMRSLDRCA